MEKIYFIHGLDCPNCAAKIERALQKMSELKTASIDFMAEKLLIETQPGISCDEVLPKIQKLADQLEPGVTIDQQKDGNASHAHSHEHEGCSCEIHHHEHGHNQHHVYHHEHEQGLEHSHDEKVTMHDHDNSFLSGKLKIIQILVSAVLFLSAWVVGEETIPGIVLFLISYVLIGWEIIWNALKNIVKGQVFDENFLMSLASIGAICIGSYPEGVAVMLLYQIGEYFQSYAVRRSRKSISDLMDIHPDFANLKMEDSTIQKVAPEQVKIDDIIVIKPGEKVPLDSIVTEGNSLIDTSALTGESVPREVSPGSKLLSGSINTSGLLTARVEKIFAESTVSKILNLVENASSRKAPAENFITKFAKYYTPIVVVAALLLAVLPPLLLQESFTKWIYQALTFLVISCPCALVISVPLSFFAGIGGASKAGILVKGSNYLEILSKAETVIFDKTGTLTKGSFEVSKIVPIGCTEERFLTLMVQGESSSNHPISKSIRKAYEHRFGSQPDFSNISGYSELSGRGISAQIEGKEVLLGNQKLMSENQISVPAVKESGTIVHLAEDGVYLGYLIISDQVKADSKQAVSALKEIGVSKTVMLTGDNFMTAEAIAQELGIDEVHAELLPDGKVEWLEKLLSSKKEKSSLAFVGDGINDAPVLARADIGIAMGGVGSDAAIEAADVVIMTDEPSKIPTAIRHAKRTLSIVKQNIIFALGIKILILILGAFGIATMWEAVFADVGVCLIAILSAMRAMKVK